MGLGIQIPQDLDIENLDFETVDVGGLPEPGRYHVRLTKCETSDGEGRTPSENLTFMVLAGTVPGQEGKFLTERIFHSSEDYEKNKKMIKRAIAIGKRMGVYTEAKMKAGDPVDFTDAEEKEFIIDVEETSYTDKTGAQKKGARMGYMGIYSLDDPRVVDCPRGGKASAGGGSPANANRQVEPAKGNSGSAKRTTNAPAPAQTRTQQNTRQTVGAANTDEL